MATVAAVMSLPAVLWLLLFLNQPRLLFALAASTSDVPGGESSVLSVSVWLVLAVVLALEVTFVNVVEAVDVVRECDGRLEDGVGVVGSAASAIGSRRGVGTGVMSVDAVTSTSSASRYHFRRRV